MIRGRTANTSNRHFPFRQLMVPCDQARLIRTKRLDMHISKPLTAPSLAKQPDPPRTTYMRHVLHLDTVWLELPLHGILHERDGFQRPCRDWQTRRRHVHCSSIPAGSAEGPALSKGKHCTRPPVPWGHCPHPTGSHHGNRVLHRASGNLHPPRWW